MELKVLGLEIIARKAAGNLQPVPRAGMQPVTGATRGGWYPVIKEPFTGAWQQNAEIQGSTALSYFAAFSCVTLIAADVGKLTLRLVQRDSEGIWTETQNPAYSPFLRKPNRYQTTVKFVEQWITSKLIHGNAYVLKETDARGVVRAAYVLDPTKVTPLVAPDGAVYYELRRNDLAGLGADRPDTIAVPASALMHDPMVTLFHPLIGVTPLYACGLSALQGLTIQQRSNSFFAAGSNPGGVLTAPGAIGDDTAARLKEYWETNFTGENIGRIAVLGDGLKYEPMSVNAADAQLIEQLRWTAETICACYHVPIRKIIGAPGTPVANVEAEELQYLSQCLQSLIVSLETTLDEGLGIAGSDLGVEFDIDDLIYMDTATRTKAASDAIGSGAMAPNEARRKYFGLGSVKGGDTPYMQQQNYSLAALDERDKGNPLATPPPPPALPAADETDETDETDQDPPPPETKRAVLSAVALALLRKDWTGLSNGGR